MSIVGRERELALLDAFVRDGPQQALVLTGGVGIGRTTLWRAGVVRARDHGVRVLAARPTRGERGLSFAAVGDVLDGVALEGIEQRHALEVALLRAEPDGPPPEPHAIGLGLVAVLERFAPALVAIDDVQWLDDASAAALAFAARRSDARFLVTRRSHRAAPLERVFERPRRVALDPLGGDATRRLLADRLGSTLPRRVLGEVVDAAHGNPLFALELGRRLVELGVPEIGEPLVLPRALDELIGGRVERLPPAIRRVLLTVALSPGARAAELTRIDGRDALDAALACGAVALDGDRCRPAHPLLGAAAVRRARAGERRALHRELAAAVTDPLRAARHLALATTRPDGALADRLAAAAAGAAASGAVVTAAELARHALRLTPPEASVRGERLLTLAERLDVAGEDQQVTDLIVPALEWLPAGEPRVRAHLLLGDGGAVAHADEHEQHLERALEECQGEESLRGPVLARRAIHVAVVRVERVAQAEAWALESGDPAALAWTRSLRGRAIEGLHDGAAIELYDSIARIAAVRQVWRGEIDAGREALTRLLAHADDRGEAWSYFVLRVHRCELELRVGAWAAASRLLDEWEQAADGTATALCERCRALEAAGRGDPEAAERWAAAAIAAADATGMRWDGLEALRARGVAALLAGRPALAAESLGAVWAATEAAGIEEPGAFPVAPDLVEALVTVGRDDEAAAVATRLGELAQDHPWGRAGVLRCRGLLDPGETVGLAGAAEAYERLGLRFDAARSLLLLGRASRRGKQWSAARTALERAAKDFDALGSPGWAAHTRAELERVGGRRRRASGVLTPSERRAAELAAAGRSNEEIAQELFIATHTVEVHLSRVYAKLGVHSRAQLATRL